MYPKTAILDYVQYMHLVVTWRSRIIINAVKNVVYNDS